MKDSYLINLNRIIDEIHLHPERCGEYAAMLRLECARLKAVIDNIKLVLHLEPNINQNGLVEYKFFDESTQAGMLMRIRDILMSEQNQTHISRL